MRLCKSGTSLHQIQAFTSYCFWLLCLLLTSHDKLYSVASVDSTSMRPPRVRTRSFPPSIRRIYTSGPCSCWASSCLADLPAFVCLMRFLFVGSVVCRRLPSAHASRRWPCHWLCAWRYLLHSGLAPIRTRPCRAHKKTPPIRRPTAVSTTSETKVQLLVNSPG